MKKILIIIVILSMMPLLGDKIVPLPDLLNPESVSIDETQMYITEKTTVYIYSLADFKLIKKFGKAGSGPREFVVTPQAPLFLNSQGKNLLLSSQLKVSRFSKKGEYIKENRTAGLFTSFFRSLDDQFAGTRLIVENNLMYFTVELYDKNFEKGKQIFKQKHFMQQGGKMNPLGRLPFFSVYKNNVYVENASGKIHRFDKNGKEVKVIAPEYKPLLVTKEHKKQVINFFKTDPGIKQFWNFFKDNLEFPKYFASIRQSLVVDGMIYIQTWRVKDNKSELLIYDIDGNFKKKMFVKLPDVDIMSRSPLTVNKNKIYHIVENVDEEQWDLHIIDLK